MGINIKGVDMGEITIPVSRYENQSGRPIKDVIIELDGRISKIEENMCILRNDSERLEKFPALAKAYEEYKIIERLVYGNEK